MEKVQKEKKQNWWTRKSKGGKTAFIIEMVLLLVCLFALTTFLFAREFYGNEIANEIYKSETIPNGFVFIGENIKTNIPKVFLSLAVIAIVWGIAIVAVFLTNLFTKGNKRSRTIGSIIKSIIKYASFIIGFAIVLVIWGVNVTGIVASLGILTLIIGLGCQSLIQDVVSGLFIVFDDYFSVGDMVIIDGFRGYVSEIGLRSVKIDDRVGDIKTITNSNIGTCVNLSREDNMITVDMPASYFEDIERVEAVFARELPKIAKRIPQILNGITYKGISNFSDAGIEFTFAAHCLTADRFQVKRDLNREIYQMFVKNDIVVPFNQITINNPDSADRPLASAEDKQLSQGLINQQRAITPKGKKTRFVNKVKASFEETLKEVDSGD